MNKFMRSVIILDCKHLMNHLLKSTALELTCGRSNNMEERLNSEGKTVIPMEELEKIINIDETCLLLDGSKCNREWPVTVAMSLKGGMDEREFMSYFLNSIMPLFPDAQDVPGKRVIMKVDSGPGRMEIGFLAEARTLGFIIYPGVPNTTAVTQETDQSYGPFKTLFQKNLKILSDSRLIGYYTVFCRGWLDLSCLEGPIPSLVLLFHAVCSTWASPKKKMCGVGKVWCHFIDLSMLTKQFTGESWVTMTMQQTEPCFISKNQTMSPLIFCRVLDAMAKFSKI
ncbi:LOW QUALITY PROTEIN: hypothetical protein ACHAW6_007078 [Cyclotella cf. meneghiniana]